MCKRLQVPLFKPGNSTSAWTMQANVGQYSGRRLSAVLAQK
jgi:hypothetical protein